MQPELFTINAFCEAHSISRATFYRMAAQGRGPKTVRLGDRMMITREAAADWRAQLAKQPAETAAPASA